MLSNGHVALLDGDVIGGKTMAEQRRGHRCFFGEGIDNTTVKRRNAVLISEAASEHNDLMEGAVGAACAVALVLRLLRQNRIMDDLGGARLILRVEASSGRPLAVSVASSPNISATAPSL